MDTERLNQIVENPQIVDDLVADIAQTIFDLEQERLKIEAEKQAELERIDAEARERVQELKGQTDISWRGLGRELGINYNTLRYRYDDPAVREQLKRSSREARHKKKSA